MFYLAVTLFWGLVLQVFIPGFPKETLLLLSGSSFGIVGGAVINWLGMVVGAQVAYEVVYRSVRLGGRFAGVLDRYEQNRWILFLQQYGLRGLFALRLVPTAPNDILSMVSGGIFLPRLGFFLVSVVTAIPYAIFFSYLGWIGGQFLGWQTMWMINLSILAVILVFSGISHLLSRETSS